MKSAGGDREVPTTADREVGATCFQTQKQRRGEGGAPRPWRGFRRFRGPAGFPPRVHKRQGPGRLQQQIPFGNDRKKSKGTDCGAGGCGSHPSQKTRRKGHSGWWWRGGKATAGPSTRSLQRPRSEVVTFLNLCDFLTHKSFVFRAHFCEKTKKSQALRMTAFVWARTKGKSRSFDSFRRKSAPKFAQRL